MVLFCLFRIVLVAMVNIDAIYHCLPRMLKMLHRKEVLTQNGHSLVSQLAPKYP